jgi:hypothetical protein
MDLNSYLTDFFSLLSSNNNMRGGLNNRRNAYRMRGGNQKYVELQAKVIAKTPSVKQIGFAATDSNLQILKYYFGDTVNESTDLNATLKLKDDKKDEFIANQVEIVEYMLERSKAATGPASGEAIATTTAFYGGFTDGQPEAAAITAATEDKISSAAIAAAFTERQIAVGCGVVRVIQNNTEVKDMNWTESDFSDCVGRSASDLDVIIDQIIPIIKSRVSDIKGRILLRNRIGNRLLGKLFTDVTIKLFKNRLGNRFMGGSINTKLQN